MRTSQANRYARWAAAAAILLTAIVIGVYLHRTWLARRARQAAPPAVPATVQQRSAEFSFSKVEKDRTIFTVRASRATEFKEGGRNLLEDVWITIYGQAGQRFDNIHTQACDYNSSTGRIVCAGEVQMDLESAEDARLHPRLPTGTNPAAHIIHVGTSAVSFDRDTGVASSDHGVEFSFPQGRGRAQGVTYSSSEGVLRLLHDVALTLKPLPATGTAPRKAAESKRAAQSLEITGSSLAYRRDDRVLRLLGPVRAQQAQRELAAGELMVELDSGLRVQRLVASNKPELRSADARGLAVLSADEFATKFHPQGWVERIVAAGNARGTLKGPGGQDHVTAARLELEMLPGRNQPRLLTASGGVTAESSRAAPKGASRKLETAGLQLVFAAPGPSSAEQAGRPDSLLLARAETTSPAVIEWQAPAIVAGNAVQETTRVRAQRMSATFGPENQVRELTGSDGVEVERHLGNALPQISSSRELVAKFGQGGEWSEIDQSGQVRFREGERVAQADHARLERTSGSITLTGSVALADSSTLTTANSVSFQQRTGDIQADGSVLTSELSAGRSTVSSLAPQPARISAAHLSANSVTGRAMYSGGARLWQGPSVVEADSIELIRSSRMLIARGHVRGVFPQAAGPTAALPKSASGPPVWRVRAGTLTYWSGEARARLEQAASAESDQGQIAANLIDLFFSPKGSADPAGSGAQELVRAVATGGVTVRQVTRRGTAERAEYFVAEQKFVLSGGRPTLRDASGDTTAGRQLTFFFANDTIIVESEEGSRTLTRHRVEK